MNFEEQKKILSELIFANEQFKVNIEQFKKLENIQNLISTLEHVDIAAINKIDFQKAGDEIFQKVNENLTNNTVELNKRIDKFSEAVDGLMQIDIIAENTSLIVDNNEKIKNKIKFMPSLIIALSVGFFTFFASNFNHFFSEKIQNESIFIDIVESPYFMIDPSNRNTIYLNLSDEIKASFLQDMTNKDRYLIKFER